MISKIKSVMVSTMLIGAIHSANAADLWTADIDNILAYTDGRAKTRSMGSDSIDFERKL